MCVRAHARVCVRAWPCIVQTDPGFIPRVGLNRLSARVVQLELVPTETQTALLLAAYLPAHLPAGSTVTAVENPGPRAVLVLMVQLSAGVSDGDLQAAMFAALNAAARDLGTLAAALSSTVPDVITGPAAQAVEM